MFKTMTQRDCFSCVFYTLICTFVMMMMMMMMMMMIMLMIMLMMKMKMMMMMTAKSSLIIIYITKIKIIQIKHDNNHRTDLLFSNIKYLYINKTYFVHKNKHKILIFYQVHSRKHCGMA